MKDISLYESIPPEKNDFTLKFRRYENRTSLIPHWHEHIELLFFLKGSCEIVAGGHTVKAGAGDLAVINGSEIHSFTAEEPANYYCLILTPAFFSDIDTGELCFQNLIVGDEYIKEAFDGINEAYLNIGAFGDMMQKSHTYRLMAHLGNPHERLRAVHIAGTNGKGSTSHLIAATLQAQGYKVGLFTSPHLVDFRERIRISGEMISEATVVQFVTENRSFLDTLRPLRTYGLFSKGD